MAYVGKKPVDVIDLTKSNSFDVTTSATVGGDLTISDKIVHSGDTNTAIRFADADTVTIETGGSERLRVDSSGSVGVGVTSPHSELDVRGAGEIFTVQGDGGASAEMNLSLINGTVNKSCIINFGKNLATSDRYLGRIMYEVDNNNMDFYTNGGRKLRILTGGGIVFGSDTATANALDDYEEGTFTPTYTAASSNPTVGYSNQIGRYVKIGQLVHCSIRISTSTVSGGSGVLFISGLPFAAETVTNMYSTFSIGYSATFNTNHPQSGFLINGGTSIQLLRNGGNNSFTAISTGISVSDMVGAGNDVIGAITYRTSA